MRRLASILPSGLAALLVLALPAPAGADDLAKAKALVERKAWADAVDVLRGVLGTSPGHREAGLLAARAYVEGGDIDAFPLAEDALHAALKADAADKGARLAIANLYLAKGRSESADPSATSAVATFFADAEEHFRKVLDATGGTDEDAGAGLVQVSFQRGDFAAAVAAADGLLAKKPSSAKVAYWKGQALYFQGRDAWGRGEQAPARDLFRRARGAYEASVKSDPTSFDAWMQLAYACQYVGDEEALATARQAYEKALDLDATSHFPMKGIEALYQNQPKAKYEEALVRLAKEHPKNLAVKWFLGYGHLAAGRWDEALAVLAEYAKAAEKPDGAWVWIGLAHEGKGDAAKARDAWEKALAANPENLEAAAAIEKQVQAQHGRLGSPKDAQALLQAYAPLLKAAPKNPFVRNNLGFVLREAVPQGGTVKGQVVEVAPAWLPILKECVRVYEEAVQAIGEVDPRLLGLPWATRYDYAGIVNDAGLMYHYYPQVADLARAQDYYERALEMTEDGYRDACTNLVRLHVEASRFEDAYRVAQAGVESLKDRDGAEDSQGRSMVQGLLQMLESKVGGD